MDWVWLLGAYWLVSIPVAIMLGRLLRSSEEEAVSKK